MELNTRRYDLKSILLILIPLLATLILTVFLQTKFINDPNAARSWIQSFGNYTILAYVVIQSIAIIIAPIGGFSAAIAALAIFGPVWGSILIYSVVTPCYLINFIIARKFGHVVVKKLVGEQAIKMIDKYSLKLTPSVLATLKILLSSNFDYISYAAGFTKISLRKYFWLNIFLGIPNVLIMYLILTLSPNFTSGIALLWLQPVIVGVIYIPFRKRINNLFLSREF